MGIVLLILGVVYLARRPKIAGMQAANYPNVPPAEFERWRRLEIWSIDVFLVTTFGLAAAGLLLGFALGAMVGAGSGSPDQLNSLSLYLMAGQGILFLVGLVVSAIFGSQAAALRKSLGITMPK